MQCFAVMASEIGERFDPYSNQPSFKSSLSDLKKKRILKPLGSVAEKIFSGATPLSGGDSYTDTESGIHFIRSGELPYIDEYNSQIALKIKSDIHNKALKRSQLKKGDVLIAIVGATIGEVGIYKSSLPANINQAISGVRLGDEIIPEFLEVFLKSKWGQVQLDQLKRPVARANLNLDEIAKILVPSLDILDQESAIKTYSTALQGQHSKTKEAEKLLTSIDDYVLSELGITLPEIQPKSCFTVRANEIQSSRLDAYYNLPHFVEIAHALHDGKYPCKKLEELIAVLAGGATPRVEGDAYADEADGVPFLRVQNITKLGLSLDDVKYLKHEIHEKELARSKLSQGDLLFTITGRIGSAAIVPKGFEGNINQHSVKIRLKAKVDSDNTPIIPEYVCAFFNTNFANGMVLREVTGGTRPALDYKAIRQLEVPLPSDAVQKRIAAEVQSRMERAQALKREAAEGLEAAKKQVEAIILGGAA